MTDEIILERLRFAAQTVISESALRDAKFDLAEDVMRRMVMARLEAEVLAEHLVDDTYTFTLHIPRSRWQVWKERHAPQWFLRLRPVRDFTVDRTVRFHRYAKYPWPTVRFPKELGRPVLHERVEDYGSANGEGE